MLQTWQTNITLAVQIPDEINSTTPLMYPQSYTSVSILSKKVGVRTVSTNALFYPLGTTMFYKGNNME